MCHRLLSSFSFNQTSCIDFPFITNTNLPVWPILDLDYLLTNGVTSPNNTLFVYKCSMRCFSVCFPFLKHVRCVNFGQLLVSTVSVIASSPMNTHVLTSMPLCALLDMDYKYSLLRSTTYKLNN